MLEHGKRYAVFSLNHDERRKTTIWVRAGNAWVNKDGSLNLYLDVLPLEGRLHVREAGDPRHTMTGDGPAAQVEPLLEAAAMGVAQ